MNFETICSISTAPGQGAISIIRVSGSETIKICNNIFHAYNKTTLKSHKANNVILGKIIDNKIIIDEVLITIFRSPKSYTGEDMIEISCHGSIYIQTKIMQTLIKYGCRMAKKGEFTMRSFLNGKLDLSQAEGVAALIASENKKSHQLAMKQMRGGFSNEIKILRTKFIKFASLIELELDFSQEDVEFADRKELLKLINEIKIKIKKLIQSFKLGNAIKNGVPITIIGKPNCGKSTLLNQILNEDRAIVSDIRGTTRDTIEESINIKGYNFRFIDTAGIRNTDDKIEKIGISKTYQKISESAFVLYMIDKTDFEINNIEKEIIEIKKILNIEDSLIIVGNKNDINNKKINFQKIKKLKILDVSAKNGKGVQELLDLIVQKIDLWQNINQDIIVINQRHFEALMKTSQSIEEIEKGVHSKLSGEFLSLDIKNCLQFLGEITGEITNENLLQSIFNDFCIGK